MDGTIAHSLFGRGIVSSNFLRTIQIAGFMVVHLYFSNKTQEKSKTLRQTFKNSNSCDQYWAELNFVFAARVYFCMWNALPQNEDFYFAIQCATQRDRSRKKSWSSTSFSNLINYFYTKEKKSIKVYISKGKKRKWKRSGSVIWKKKPFQQEKNHSHYKKKKIQRLRTDLGW